MDLCSIYATFADIYDLLLTLILPFADIITFYGPL